MEYIIFGAGSSGRKAALDLGLERVGFFASNDCLSNDREVRWIHYRKVISFEEMINRSRSGDYIIVVASERYAIEMDSQLRDEGIKKYFVYHEFDVAELWKLYPYYYLYRTVHTLNYAKVFSLYKIGKYKRIGIYGSDYYLPYVISEISFQNSYESIVGVIPDDKTSCGARSMGIPVYSIDEMWNEIDCLVVNMKWNQSDIRSTLDLRQHSFDVVDIYDIEKFEPAFRQEKLLRFRNIHKNKRAFIIGNGPSLLSEDLDKLYECGELCFGANAIYKIFPKTEWRPDYLCFIDPCAVEISKKVIENYSYTVFIADDVFHRFSIEMPDTEQINIIHLSPNIVDNHYPYKPGFSQDIVTGLKTSMTVTYFALQIAVYMGINEIYLLGVDNTISLKSGEGEYFTDEYLDRRTLSDLQEREVAFSNMEQELAVHNVEFINKGYEKAEEYSRAHGFRIYNATRGGKLETFERVDFDSLFPVKHE